MANDKARVLNINVGILGHVDSGKTSLVAALSTHLSTAALDKHPQSKERGITLDLGFSSFIVPLPPHLSHLPYDALQFTLVDCPGHASLIRTIIGGIQIIDMMVLVVDVTKGLQAQTAECLVVGEVATPRMVVALNKTDMLPAEERSKLIKKVAKRISQTLSMTKFAGAPMVPVSARPSGPAPDPSKEGSDVARPTPAAEGVDILKVHLMALVPPKPRVAEGSFLFAIDHCFPIKGQGTVMTGTVLKGSVSVGETVELPALKIQRPVRSMQAFKRPVQKAIQGDRVGICVAQLDADLLERGLAAAPSTVPTFSAAIASVEKIRFFAGKVTSGTHMHISVGHDTVMATVSFFGLPDGQGYPASTALQALIANLSRLSLGGTPAPFTFNKEYVHQEELYGLEGRPLGASLGVAKGQAGAGQVPGAPYADEERHHGAQWALLRFDQPLTAPQDALLIGSRFDADIHGESCRLAFYGRLVALVDPSKPQEMAQIKVYKEKERVGSIERIQPDGTTAVCKGLFKKETDISVFTGLKVTTGRGEPGVIEGSFGKSGKFKVEFPGGLDTSVPRSPADNTLTLRFKRYIHDPDKKRRPKQ